ncbi:hypothetical protein MMC29_005795 [Sticta canariensis]|nr:hypothetical protein [Sticta canariensis]
MPERRVEGKKRRSSIVSSGKDMTRTRSGTTLKDLSIQKKWSKTSTSAILPSHDSSNDDSEVGLHSQHEYRTPSSSVKLREVLSSSVKGSTYKHGGIGPASLANTDSNSQNKLSDSKLNKLSNSKLSVTSRNLTTVVIRLIEFSPYSLKMSTTLAPSDFQKIFNKATTSNAALVNSINSQPDYWLENLKALHDLATLNTELTATNSTFTERIHALKGVDEEFISARESATASHDALNQALGGHMVYKDQIAELTEQLRIATSNPAATSHTKLSSKHPDPEKFSGDCDKLDAWIIQINTKMSRNADHFVFAGQNTS